MAAVLDEPARPACPARPYRHLGRAQKPGREVERERRLADAIRPDDEDGVRHGTPDHGRDDGDRGRLAPRAEPVHLGSSALVGGWRLPRRAPLGRSRRLGRGLRRAAVASAVASSRRRRGLQPRTCVAARGFRAARRGLGSRFTGDVRRGSPSQPATRRPRSTPHRRPPSTTPSGASLAAWAPVSPSSAAAGLGAGRRSPPDDSPSAASAVSASPVAGRLPAASRPRRPAGGRLSRGSTASSRSRKPTRIAAAAASSAPAGAAAIGSPSESVAAGTSEPAIDSIGRGVGAAPSGVGSVARGGVCAPAACVGRAGCRLLGDLGPEHGFELGRHVAPRLVRAATRARSAPPDDLRPVAVAAASRSLRPCRSSRPWRSSRAGGAPRPRPLTSG